MQTAILILVSAGFLVLIFNTILLIYFISYLVNLSNKLKFSIAGFVENFSPTPVVEEKKNKTWDEKYEEMLIAQERRISMNFDNERITQKKEGDS